MDTPNCVNEIGTFQNEDVAHSKTSVRCKPSQTVIQRLHHLDSTFADLRVCSVSVGILWGRLPEIAEMLERRSVDICYVQEARFTCNKKLSCLHLAGKIFGKREEIVLWFVDWEKAFNRVLWDVAWWALRKLGVEQWLIKIEQSMYRKARSGVRFNGIFSDDFLVQVGLHQGPMWSPSLFIVMLEALSREIRSGC